jgi:hypothetical protein
MFLITVTDWRHKAGIIIRLLLFLLLIWLITPQFVSFISGYIASFKNELPGNQPPAQRVEQRAVQGEPEPAKDQGAFLKMLQQYYSGNAKQAPLDSE